MAALKRRRPLESSVEGYLETRCKETRTFLLKNTGRNGIPDRLLIRDGIHWFFELKRPGETPNPLQVAVAGKMRRRGAVTLWTDSKAGVDRVLAALIAHADPPEEMLYGK